jgi:hypothetical protein
MMLFYIEDEKRLKSIFDLCSKLFFRIWYLNWNSNLELNLHISNWPAVALWFLLKEFMNVFTFFKDFMTSMLLQKLCHEEFRLETTFCTFWVSSWLLTFFVYQKEITKDFIDNRYVDFSPKSFTPAIAKIISVKNALSLHGSQWFHI